MPAPESIDQDVLPVGSRLAEFEIERVLGAGGFGIVYRAYDPALQRSVAIKEYMPTALAVRGRGQGIGLRSSARAETFESGLRSFINEARLLARFDHPALVKVYRFWEANGTAYMVMPCYEGVTLREARRAMTAPVSDAWLRSLMLPLLEVLDLLHRHRVYHRDVAPDNILLLGDASGEHDCRPLLLDFGAARHVIGNHTQGLTAILKPRFAPIEQYAESSRLRQGPWTDIYALAAVAQVCITGRAPLAAPVRAVQDDGPRLAAMAEALASHYGRRWPRPVLEALDRALAVRPEDRPQSVSEWVGDLARGWPQAGLTGAGGVREPDGEERPAGSRTPARERAGRWLTDEAYVTTQPAARHAGAASCPLVTGADGGPGGAAELCAMREGASASVAAVQPFFDVDIDVGAVTTGVVEPPRAGPLGVRRGGPQGVMAMLGTAGVAVLVGSMLTWGRPPERGPRAQVPPALPMVAAAAVQATAVPVAGAVPASPVPGARPEGSRVGYQAPAFTATALESVPRPALMKEPTPAAANSAKAGARYAMAGARQGRTASLPPAPTPRAQCGKRVFIALAMCMKRVCERPGHGSHPQCVRMRKMEEANRVALP